MARLSLHMLLYAFMVYMLRCFSFSSSHSVTVKLDGCIYTTGWSPRSSFIAIDPVVLVVNA